MAILHASEWASQITYKDQVFLSSPDLKGTMPDALSMLVPCFAAVKTEQAWSSVNETMTVLDVVETQDELPDESSGMIQRDAEDKGSLRN